MTKKDEKAIQKRQPTYAERFTDMVIREFTAQIGTTELTPYQRKLAQHLFLHINRMLEFLEANRISKNQKKAPITWQNVNMQKLAIDAVTRIELGLDALIPNHIHVVPYWNSKLKKYDLDLQIGYAGKDYYRRQMAIDPPKDIIYELVHEHEVDHFKVLKKNDKRNVESYEFEITKPFDRGEVVGGFGYIIYDDPTKNRIVLVSRKEMDMARAQAKSKDFWDKHTEKMMLKTVVNRVTKTLQLDPRKTNAAVAIAESEDEAPEYPERLADEIIDGELATEQVELPPAEPEQHTEPEPKPEPEQAEQQQTEPQQGSLIDPGF